MAYRGSGGLTPYPSGTPLTGLRRELDRFFEDFGGRSGGSAWVPAVDVRENEREITLDFELPGIKADNVEVNVENGVLSVSGEKRAERKEGEQGRYHVVERSYGSFFRSFTLPQGVDESKIGADFEDGVLHVRIPKEALPQPRRIEVGRSAGAPAVAGAAQDARSKTTGTRPGTTPSGRGDQTQDRMVAKEPGAD
jgi:HSP20 family protein